jgi:hypothetical protein
MTTDHSLRILGYACWLTALAVLYLVAPLYAPHPSASEAVLMDKCLALHGMPVLNGWTGNMEGCER